MNSTIQFQLNRYKLLKKVADYGSGSLLLASDLAAHRFVLIKKTTAVNEQFAFYQECFQNELELTNYLDHGNIMPLINYGWHDGSFYAVMNHVDGCDLGALITHPQFDDSIGLMILTLALETLHHCHVKGISHGDLKPANLLITSSGQVQLTGFGVSRMISIEDQHCFFSTPLFLPPELVQIIDLKNQSDSNQFENTTLFSCRNDSWTNVVQLSNPGSISQDIWAVGVLLFRICTGIYPFNSDHFPTLLSSIIQNNPMSHDKFRTEIPKSIISIIGQCLRKNPSQRLNSLDPVLNVLHEHFHSQGISFFNEYIAHYLNQKSDLLTYSISVDEPPGMNVHGSDNTAEEQQHSKPNGYETKVLRHLVAPNYSLPQVSTTPTVKLDPRVIRAAYESQNKSINVFQKLRTLSRVYRLHIILGAAIVFLIVLLFVSGSFIIEHFSNKSSELATVQHTEKKSLFRKTSHKKRNLTSPAPHEKPLVQEENSSDRNDSIPIQQVFVSQKMSDAAKPIEKNSLSQVKTSQSGTQQVSKKSTPSTASSGTSGITKKRVQEHAISNSSQVENSVEQTGKLTISVDPPHASVFVDGTLLDKNEFESGKELTTGNHNITADAPNYEPYRNTVSIEKDQSTILAIALKAIVKGNGQVHMFSYPWANLYIDGELKGTTPTAVPILLDEGTHQLSLQRDGYETYTEELNIKTGDVLRLKVDLKKN